MQNAGSNVGIYVLNALGQRVEKIAGGAVTRFDYDEASRLFSESTGTITRDYAWLDDVPVGDYGRAASDAKSRNCPRLTDARG